VEHKSQSLTNFEIKFKSDGRFSGYASTFNNVDSYGDTILPGAYAETLKNNGLPKMFVQHDSWSLPVGKWTSAVEDEKGLYVEGEFTPNMQDAENAKAALKHETIDGLSIGFMLRRADFEWSNVVEGGRIISNVTKLLEISLVTWPADSFARVDMKGEIEKIETIRDFERFLRDSGHFSKNATAKLIAKAKALFDRGEPEKTEEKPDYGQILAKLTQINSKIEV
jgi:uncharacterized protein